MGRKMIILILTGLLAGCGHAPPEPSEAPLCRVVTQIVLQQENPSTGRQQLYRTQENMNRILSGISLLGHKFATGEVPPPEEPDDYSIILYFSDGNQKIYRYHALRYLYIQDQGWKRVNEELGEEFLQLLRSMPEES